MARFPILCGDPDHATRLGQPGYTDAPQGTSSSAESAKAGLCQACAAARDARANQVDASREATAIQVRTKLTTALGVTDAELDTVLPPPPRVGRVASAAAGLVIGAAAAVSALLAGDDGLSTPVPTTSELADAGPQGGR